MKHWQKITGVALCVIVLTGCTLTAANIIAAINVVVPVAIDAALVREAQTSPQTANAIATTISDVCKTDCIPLVNGQLAAGVLFRQLQQVIEAKTGPGWGTTIAGIMGTIFGNVNIKAPAMSADEKSYVLAGLNALASGCDLFLAGKVAMLDGTQMDRAEYMACLKTQDSTRSTDAIEKTVKHFAENGIDWPSGREILRCRNGQCGRSTWSGDYCPRCERARMDSGWDAEGDGHGQGCYR